MYVQRIQSDVSSGKMKPNALKDRVAAFIPQGSVIGYPDSYTRTNPLSAKFVVLPPGYLAQAGAAKPPLYRTVSDRLTQINNVPPGPMAEAIRRDLIERIVTQGKVVVPQMVNALKHHDKIVRSGAVDILARIFRGTGAATTWKGVVCRLSIVPGLIDALKDRDAKVRNYAAQALGAIGDTSKVVMDALREVSLKDSDAEVRKVAKETLQKLRGSTWMPHEKI